MTLLKQGDSQGFQIMGIAKRGGHCLKAVYLNLNELNTNSSSSIRGQLLAN